MFFIGPSGTFEQIKLPHPNGTESTFFFDSKLYALCRLESKTSAFVNDTVHSDGSISMLIRIDPVFLLIPFLLKSQNYLSLEHLLHTCPIPVEFSLDCICDVQVVDEVKYYKLSNLLFESWIKQKYQKLHDRTPDPEFCVKALADWFPESFHSKLMQMFGVKKRKAEPVVQKSKKPKITQRKITSFFKKNVN